MAGLRDEFVDVIIVNRLERVYALEEVAALIEGLERPGKSTLEKSLRREDWVGEACLLVVVGIGDSEDVVVAQVVADLHIHPAVCGETGHSCGQTGVKYETFVHKYQ